MIFQLSDDKEISQMICSLCVRRLSDCCELKFQIEQSEQLLLSVVSNRLFMGLNSEYPEINDHSLSKSISLIHSVVNELESSYSVCNEIIAEKSLGNEVSVDVEHAKKAIDEVNVAKEEAVPEKRPIKSTLSCSICSKKFTTSAKLERHLVNQHLVRNDLNVYKPHKCDDCPKSYTTKANLVLHMAVHSGKTIGDLMKFKGHLGK